MKSSDAEPPKGSQTPLAPPLPEAMSSSDPQPQTGSQTPLAPPQPEAMSSSDPQPQTGLQTPLREAMKSSDAEPPKGSQTPLAPPQPEAMSSSGPQPQTGLQTPLREAMSSSDAERSQTPLAPPQPEVMSSSDAEPHMEPAVPWPPPYEPEICEEIICEESKEDSYYEAELANGRAHTQGEFPECLSSFTFVPTEFILAEQIQVCLQTSRWMRAWQVNDSPALKKVRESSQDCALSGRMSPRFPVSDALDRFACKDIGLPEEAAFYAWIPPSRASSRMAQKGTDWDPDMALIHNGGWFFCDSEGKVLCIMALRPDKGGQLKFGRRKQWSAEWTRRLVQHRRIDPITIPALLAKGATHFCYIYPGECMDPQSAATKICKRGGFVYFFRKTRNDEQEEEQEQQ